MVQDVLALAFVRRHLLAYAQHVLQHVDIKQRDLFVQSLAQYLPELQVCATSQRA